MIGAYYGFWEMSRQFWKVLEDKSDAVAFLEMTAVLMLLRAIVSLDCRNVKVEVECDNSMVIALLRKKKITSNRYLLKVMRSITSLQEDENIDLVYLQVRGIDNVADPISRGKATDLEILPTHQDLKRPKFLFKGRRLSCLQDRVTLEKWKRKQKNTGRRERRRLKR